MFFSTLRSAKDITGCRWRGRLIECFAGGRRRAVKHAIFDIFRSSKRLNYPIMHLQHNSSVVRQYTETDQQWKSRKSCMSPDLPRQQLTITGVAGAEEIEDGMLDCMASPASKSFNKSRPHSLISIVLPTTFMWIKFSVVCRNCILPAIYFSCANQTSFINWVVTEI